MVFGQETLDIVNDAETMLLREIFHRTAHQSGSPASSLVGTCDNDCDIESIFDQGLQNPGRNVGSAEKCHPANG